MLTAEPLAISNYQSSQFKSLPTEVVLITRKDLVSLFDCPDLGLYLA